MNKDEALKMAIEALSQDEGWFEPEAAIKACKEALAQPAQEPVAFTNEDELSELQSGMATCYMYKQAIDDDDIALYTHPAPLWQGLSKEEVDKLYADWERGSWNYNTFADAIEQVLKEKNSV